MRALKIFAAFTVLAALIVWIGPAAITQQLEMTPLRDWACVVACILMGTLVGATNVYLLLNDHNQLRFWQWISIYWTAWGIGLITPGQIGDVAVMGFRLNKNGVEWKSALSYLLLDKMVSVLVIGSVACIWLVQQASVHVEAGSWRHAYWLISSIAVTILLVSLSPVAKSLVSRAARNAIDIAIQMISVVRHRPFAVIRNVALTFVKVLLTGASYWWAFNWNADGSLAVFDTILASSTAGLAAYLPISFNGIGVVEASGIVLFGRLGLTPQKVLAGYLCLRITILLLAWIPIAIESLISGKSPYKTLASREPKA
jgi:uncharacterized membrane protein YbhN (UPF0104 family)